MTTRVTNVFIVVDVSKKYLDIHINPTGKKFHIKNCRLGIKTFIQKLETYQVEQVVCESSGDYERLFLKMCQDTGYTTWRVDPRKIRSFAYGEGIKAKNDIIDAKIIALFASQKRCDYKQKFIEEEDKIQALARRRNDLVEMLKMEKQRLDGLQGEFCAKKIKKHIAYLEKEIKKTESEVMDMINANDAWQQKAKILKSMPGVGDATVMALVAEMPELGFVSNKEIAAILGVAPFTQQSGQRKATARIRDGRREPRKIMYMAALSAAFSNPVFKPFYSRLVKESGKPAKVALVAVMRKMIVTLNAMMRKKEVWNPQEA